jgi:hypothetical protein
MIREWAFLDSGSRPVCSARVDHYFDTCKADMSESRHGSLRVNLFFGISRA